MHTLESKKDCTIIRFAEDLLVTSQVINVVGNYKGVLLYVEYGDTTNSLKENLA